MKRVISAAAALLLCVAAQASDTFRSGSRVVVVGDSATKLLDVVGKPDLKEPIETTAGGHEGERWQYAIDGKTVSFVLKDGKIVQIDERRN